MRAIAQQQPALVAEMVFYRAALKPDFCRDVGARQLDRGALESSISLAATSRFSAGGIFAFEAWSGTLVFKCDPQSLPGLNPAAPKRHAGPHSRVH